MENGGPSASQQGGRYQGGRDRDSGPSRDDDRRNPQRYGTRPQFGFVSIYV